jgi:hypothetical protein
VQQPHAVIVPRQTAGASEDFMKDWSDAFKPNLGCTWWHVS